MPVSNYVLHVYVRGLAIWEITLFTKCLFRRRGFFFTMFHDSQQFLFINGVKEHGCLRVGVRKVINACFIFWCFDVFAEILSNIDKEFDETIGNVLLIFLCFIFVYKMVWKWGKI